MVQLEDLTCTRN